MSRRSLRRRVATWLAAFCAAYLALAYFAAPEFWSFRDRGFRTHRFEMLTHTPQGIPGDPIMSALSAPKGNLSTASPRPDGTPPTPSR